MDRVKGFFYRCAGILGAVSAVGYLAIIAICIGDVFLEKVFNTRILGSYELVERCMIISVISSFAYAQTKKAHINMMIIIERLPRLLRLIILGITSVLSVGTTGYTAYAAWTQCRTAYRMAMTTGILYIPFWPFYLVVSIALYLLAIILLLDTIYIFAAIKSDRINDMVTNDYRMDLREAKTEASSAWI